MINVIAILISAVFFLGCERIAFGPEQFASPDQLSDANRQANAPNPGSANETAGQGSGNQNSEDVSGDSNNPGGNDTQADQKPAGDQANSANDQVDSANPAEDSGTGSGVIKPVDQSTTTYDATNKPQPGKPAAPTGGQVDMSKVPAEFKAEDFSLSKKMNPTIYDFPIDYTTATSCLLSEKRDVSVYKTDDRGNKKWVTLSLCKRFYDLCLMEGSCVTGYNSCIEGRKCDTDINGKFYFLNYKGRGPNGAKFFTYNYEECPFGYGNSPNICLDIFHTVAADIRVYPIGTVIFVPIVVGTKLPDGTTHDGFFVVRDVGQKIKNRANGIARFDFFVGNNDWKNGNNPFGKLGLFNENSKIDFHVVYNASKKIVQLRRNYPKLPADERNRILESLMVSLKAMKQAVLDSSRPTANSNNLNGVPPSDGSVKPQAAPAPAKPAAVPGKPAVVPAKPTATPAKPVVVPAKPVAKPATVPAKPATPAKPVVVPAKPVAKPATVPAKPATPAKPVVVPAKPVAKPATVPAKPVTQAKPSANPPVK